MQDFKMQVVFLSFLEKVKRDDKHFFNLTSQHLECYVYSIVHKSAEIQATLS
jgi:hypothetical protein